MDEQSMSVPGAGTLQQTVSPVRKEVLVGKLWTWLFKLLQRGNTTHDEPSPTPQEIALVRAAYPAGNRAPAETQLFVMFQFGDQHGFERGRAEGFVEGAKSLLYQAPLVRSPTGEITVEIDHVGKRQMYHPPQQSAVYEPPPRQTGPIGSFPPGSFARAHRTEYMPTEQMKAISPLRTSKLTKMIDDIPGPNDTGYSIPTWLNEEKRKTG